MIVYLVRHGKAEPAFPGVADAERALTMQGLEEMQKLSALFAAMGIRPGRLFSSTLRRAVQTARAVATKVGIEVELAANLHPEGAPESVEDLLLASSVHETVMLVGHQPLLGVLVWRWANAEVPLSPGSLAVVELSAPRPGAGRLTGLYEPHRLLRLPNPIL